ncbi:uracil-DNA glycosylase family protein [Acetobacter sp. DsW_063]|uniref:uracil-DNA glycosylase family protein n=1 Tax=Acetobacter sp. DsW_063 TaxID=1514894 RepID=UPI000A38CCF8|nr:uracil-DNA glycosylase family protein [Acetobacter sp. DsW_063]
MLLTTQEVTDAPDDDCQLCPRLAQLRSANRRNHPGVDHAPIRAWGSRDASVLIVGPAPETRKGALQGPFFGDRNASAIFCETLIEHGLATGHYASDDAIGLRSDHCRVVGAVRCAPPAALPQPAEVHACNAFLKAELRAMPNLRLVLAIGALAHNATIAACGMPMARLGFQHGRVATLPDGLIIVDCSLLSAHNPRDQLVCREVFSAIATIVVETLRRQGQ